jgi:hypothetical protein
MGAKFQERGGRMLDLNMLKPVLRAYALGYASSTIPRLLGLLRTLRRQDRTIQEKLDLVSPASPLLFMQPQLLMVSNCNPTSQTPDDTWGKKTVFCISLCLSFYKTTRSPSSYPHSSIISSERLPKSTASQLHARSSSEARLSFPASYALSSSLLLNSSAAMPPSYSLRQQFLGSASSAPSSQHGVLSIYLIATQLGLASALYHAPLVSPNPFRTHQTSTTSRQPHHLHSLAKQ